MGRRSRRNLVSCEVGEVNLTILARVLSEECGHCMPQALTAWAGVGIGSRKWTNDDVLLAVTRYDRWITHEGLEQPDLIDM